LRYPGELPGKEKGRHWAAPSLSRLSRTSGFSFAYPAARARAGTKEAAFTVPHPVASL